MLTTSYLLIDFARPAQPVVCLGYTDVAVGAHHTIVIEVAIDVCEVIACYLLLATVTGDYLLTVARVSYFAAHSSSYSSLVISWCWPIV